MRPGLTPLERLAGKVALARRWVVVPPHQRVKNGRIENVDAYGYWRETQLNFPGMGAPEKNVVSGPSASREILGSMKAYTGFADTVGADETASIGRENQLYVDENWENVESHNVSPAFRARVERAIKALKENPRLQPLIERYGTGTFAVGSKRMDGGPALNHLAAEGFGHIYVLEQPDFGPEVEGTPRLNTPVRDEDGDIRGMTIVNTHQWAGFDGNVRHEFGHRVSNILFDHDRDGDPAERGLPGPVLDHGKSGQELKYEWMDVSGPYMVHVYDPFTGDSGLMEPDEGLGPIGFISGYGAQDPREGFSEVFMFVTSPNYEEWKAEFLADLAAGESPLSEADSLRLIDMMEWVEGLVDEP